ncbi:hypothetical protein GCM10010478_54810 [Streptomyces erythrogriseus]|uniref:Uncharacterized protein n=3 Tax=Streptomyces TaxID=1883 RepID=A0ABN3XB06_9ACTN|nr:hypothetical protein GCM10010265_64770 [Streptomyces griseoincarnatus]GGT57101.1 hypothetical protein GCM10010287_34060 [Streptomyces variabilis]
MTGILYGDVWGRGKEGRGCGECGGKFTYPGGPPPDEPLFTRVGRVNPWTRGDGPGGGGEGSKGDGRDVF